MTQNTKRGLAVAAFIGVLAFLFVVMCAAIANAQSPSDTCANGDHLVLDTSTKRYKCITPGATPAGTGTTMIVANASSTGTTVNKFAKLTGAPSTAVISSNGDTDGAIGVVTSGAGTTGSATITILGQASCVFDGATTAGDYVTIAATGGGCHDAGATYPTGTTVYGRVLSTNGGAGTYVIELMTPDITGSAATSSNGKNKPGGVDTQYQINSSGNSLAGGSLFQDTANRVFMRNGSSSQTLWIMRTYTSGSSFQGLNLSVNSSGDATVANLDNTASLAGGDFSLGGAGTMYFYANAVRWAIISSSGDLIPYGSDGGFSVGSTGGGGKRINSLFFAGTLTGIQGSLNASKPMISHTATWNNAVTFENDKSVITDTSSNSDSTLIDRQVGSTSMFRVAKTGIPTFGGDTRNTSDVTSTSTTPAAITGLTATVINGATYTFRLTVYFADSVAADGARFDFDGGAATFSNVRIHCNTFDTALLNSQQSTAIATDFVITTTTGDSLQECTGTLTASADGTFIPRFGQEAHSTGTITAYKGSTLQVIRVN